MTFSDLRVEELTAHRAVVRFTTNQPASCEAEYGAGDRLDLRATDPDMAPGQRVIDHRVPLEDLLADTGYQLRARVEDEDGRVSYSGTIDFRTPTATSAPAGINRALSMNGARVAEVSSNWAHGSNSDPFGAELAIDGKMATEWSTHGDGDGAYLVIELPQAASIAAVGFRSREMTDGSSIIRKIRVLPEGAAAIGPLDTPDPSQRYLFQLDEPVVAARWRIEAVETSGGNTGAREIELWAR
jgi:hypothetical protein